MSMTFLELYHHLCTIRFVEHNRVPSRLDLFHREDSKQVLSSYTKSQYDFRKHEVENPEKDFVPGSSSCTANVLFAAKFILCEGQRFSPHVRFFFLSFFIFFILVCCCFFGYLIPFLVSLAFFSFFFFKKKCVIGRKDRANDLGSRDATMSWK